MSLLSFAAPLLLRVALVLSLALAAARLRRSSSASLRRYLLLLGAVAALLLPLASWAAAGRQVVEVPAPGAVAHVVAEALTPDQGAGATQPAPSLPGASAGATTATIVGILWLLGSLAVFVHSAIGLRRASRLSSRSEPLGDARISADVAGPVTVGLFSPTILLPVAARDWTPERLQAVMLHERAHVQQRDGLALLLARAACALYWFVPQTWWLLARLRRECELSADEVVLAAGLRPTSYAEHLLAIARAMRVPASGVAMAARPSELSRRIAALLSRSGLAPRLTRVRASFLALVTLFLVLLVACTGGPSTPTASGSVAAPPSDGRAQALARGEAERAQSEWGASRVAIVVLDARTHRVLASTDTRPHEPIVPASTLKTLTVALALDAGVIDTQQRFDCGNGARAYDDRSLSDAGKYGLLTAGEILAVSSNVGTSRIFDALGGDRLSSGLGRFQVAAPAELPNGSLRGAVTAIGQATPTTPLAMARAYAILANDGVDAAGARVVSAATAQSVRDLLEGVVHGDRANGRAAAVPGWRVGGKTGTSDEQPCEHCASRSGLFASFVGIAPIDRPRYVIYVGVGQPQKPGTGGTIAAPVFSRLAARLLASGG